MNLITREKYSNYQGAEDKSNLMNFKIFILITCHAPDIRLGSKKSSHPHDASLLLTKLLEKWIKTIHTKNKNVQKPNRIS